MSEIDVKRIQKVVLTTVLTPKYNGVTAEFLDDGKSGIAIKFHAAAQTVRFTRKEFALLQAFLSRVAVELGDER